MYKFSNENQDSAYNELNLGTFLLIIAVALPTIIELSKLYLLILSNL